MRYGEVETCRERLAKFCNGNGLDLGFGGNPIVPWAICIDQNRPAHLPNPGPTHLVGDATRLRWFSDNVFDFVFSSHLLEDFDDTAAVMLEWLRVIKRGGHLVLYLPNQQEYLRTCAKTGQDINTSHKHADFSLEYMQTVVLPRLNPIPVAIVHELYPVPNNPYSFDLVLKKQ